MQPWIATTQDICWYTLLLLALVLPFAETPAHGGRAFSSTVAVPLPGDISISRDCNAIFNDLGERDKCHQEHDGKKLNSHAVRVCLDKNDSPFEFYELGINECLKTVGTNNFVLEAADACWLPRVLYNRISCLSVVKNEFFDREALNICKTIGERLRDSPLLAECLHYIAGKNFLYSDEIRNCLEESGNSETLTCVRNLAYTEDLSIPKTVNSIGQARKRQLILLVQKALRFFRYKQFDKAEEVLREFMELLN